MGNCVEDVTNRIQKTHIKIDISIRLNLPDTSIVTSLNTWIKKKSSLFHEFKIHSGLNVKKIKCSLIRKKKELSDNFN